MTSLNLKSVKLLRLYLRPPAANKCWSEVRAVRNLSAERALQSVQISTIAHATDDLEKVQIALRFILPESLKGKEIFTRKYVQGHHGNPIVTFEAKLTKRQEVNQFTDRLTKQLPEKDKLLVKHNLGVYSDDEGNLYIRLSKQQAFRGEIELCDEDPIRVRLKFSRLSGGVTELMKTFLESE